MKDWTSCYILVRPYDSYKLKILHSVDKLKDARYWLQYLAEPGDAIFITPLHNQYNGRGTPTYMTHLAERGKMEFNENHWRYEQFENNSKPFEFTLEEKNTDTKVFNFNDNNSGCPIFIELNKLLNLNSKDINSLLADASILLNSNSALTLKNNNIYILSTNRDSEWPTTLTLKISENNENKDYEPEIKFMVKPRTSV